MNYKREFDKKFKVKELEVFETKYWIWSVRPVQTTIGSGILSLKRECLHFSDLKQEEFSDLYNIISIIESSLKRSFGYEIINYLMLMMEDKQVHYHVIPRYSSSMEFLGSIWKDNGWPGIPELVGVEPKDDILERIRVEIKKHMIII